MLVALVDRLDRVGARGEAVEYLASAAERQTAERAVFLAQRVVFLDVGHDVVLILGDDLVVRLFLVAGLGVLGGCHELGVLAREVVDVGETLA